MKPTSSSTSASGKSQNIVNTPVILHRLAQEHGSEPKVCAATLVCQQVGNLPKEKIYVDYSDSKIDDPQQQDTNSYGIKKSKVPKATTN